MPSRYQNTKQRLLPSGKRVLAMTVYPEIEETANDYYVTVGAGDRLDLLAHRYYKDFSLWWIIAKANGLHGDSYFIDAGTTIRIPTDINVILEKFKEANESRFV